MAATVRMLYALPTDSSVSVPYSSGQWLQLPSKNRFSIVLDPFQSPIHRVNGCNPLAEVQIGGVSIVSVPYSSGQWLQLLATVSTSLRLDKVSVPYSSGQWLQQKDNAPPPHI